MSENNYIVPGLKTGPAIFEERPGFVPCWGFWFPVKMFESLILFLEGPGLTRLEAVPAILGSKLFEDLLLVNCIVGYLCPDGLYRYKMCVEPYDRATEYMAISWSKFIYGMAEGFVKYCEDNPE